MCRITVMTPMRLRHVFFHAAMLHAQTEAQEDGAGITDGEVVVKTGNNYSSSINAEAYSVLDHSFTWVGHVRKASAGTAYPSHAASHPYVWGKVGDGNRLVLVHNGFVNVAKREKDEINTDSWRAGRDLFSGLTANKGEMTNAILESWIASFRHKSEWAFVIQYQESTYLVRGQRELWMTYIDGALFVNTSKLVVEGAVALASSLELSTDEVTLLPEHSITKVELVHGRPVLRTDLYRYKEPEAPSYAKIMVMNPDGKVSFI